MYRFLAPALAAFFLFAPSSCASLTPAAALRLAGFDPLEADPAAIAVAVRTSDRLRLRNGDVTMRVGFESKDKSLEFDEHFELQIVGGDVGTPPGGALSSGEHVQIAQVAVADRARLAATQAKARAARGKGNGSLEVAVNGGCRTGEIDPASLSFSTYMRTAVEGEFFQLTRDMSLARAFGADAIAGIPPCGQS